MESKKRIKQGWVWLLHDNLWDVDVASGIVKHFSSIHLHSRLDISTGDMVQQKQQHIGVITANANTQTWLLLRQFMKMIYDKCVGFFVFWVQCKYLFSYDRTRPHSVAEAFLV